MPSQEMGKKTVPKRLICDISETEMDGKAAQGERHTHNGLKPRPLLWLSASGSQAQTGEP